MDAPLVRIAVVLIGLYLAWGALMTVAHPYFIYPFDARDVDLPGYERVMVEVPGADPVRVALAEAGPEAPVVLYFMGNAGSIGIFRDGLEQHRAAGRNVVAMEFRGGGGNAGRPSEARLKADALAVFDWAAARYGPEVPLIVHGYSLGTGLALHVAARREVSGVILVAPYARLCTLMARASFLPACLMPGVQKWRNTADARLVGQPVLILHGERDAAIPIGEGRRLEAALRAAGTPVEFEAFPDGTHENLHLFERYRDRIGAWVASLPPAR